MEAVFTQSHRSKFRAAAKITVGFRPNMGVDHHGIFCDGDGQVFEVTGAVEKLPVFVRLDRIVPPHTRDGFASSEKRIAGHVAPGQRADTLMFTAVHPNPFTIHQRTEQQRASASALAYSENVEFMFVEPLKDAVQMQFGSDDVIVV